MTTANATYIVLRVANPTEAEWLLRVANPTEAEWLLRVANPTEAEWLIEDTADYPDGDLLTPGQENRVHAEVVATFTLPVDLTLTVEANPR